jgi:deazaflavin-dependent oxidoreductase (nitroreductase family)
VTAFNDRIIAQFRAGAGHVDGFGDRLVIIHSRGARTGAERTNPALSLPDGDSRLVIASAAGAPKNPGWYYNLRAHPDAAIEDGSGRLIPVAAHELDGADYQVAWTRFDAASPAFRQYRQRAGRRLPIFRLTPKPEGEQR